MHIDMPTVILGMATMAVLVGAVLAASTLLRADGPLPPRLGFIGALFNVIFGLLTALYLIASYTLPEDSMIYEQLVGQRLMYVTVIVTTVVGAAVLWRMAIRWTPTEPTA